MSDNKIAFFIGLFSSLHCLGMCGPLALAIPMVKGRAGLLLLWDKLTYNFGRIITYCTLGSLAGIIGSGLWMAGLQQWVSIISGVLILLAAASRLIKNKPAAFGWGKFAFVNGALTYALKHQWGHLFIGVLNGFLPCGFVYMAMAGAINTGSVQASGMYMFWFGMGTLPLMLLAMVGSGFFSMPLRSRLNKIAPYAMLFLGAWFILRGLHLNIPYLSPPPVSNTVMCR